MATADAEHALGELYRWDVAIEDMYALGESHADFDEDTALEAYEEIIQVGTTGEKANDHVLSLAVQLLAKHFYKFPHVHLNVVDAVATLCKTRSPVVRIHSAQSLVAIAKGSKRATPPLASGCCDRIVQRVRELAKSERSKVVMEQLTLVQKTLNATEDVKSKPKDAPDNRASKKDERNASDKPQQPKSSDTRSDRAPDRKDTKRVDDGPSKQGRSTSAERKQDAKRDSRSEEVPARDDRRRDSNASDHVRERRLSSGGREGSTNMNSQGCPPSPFIFVGGVPRDTASRDIVNFLSCIDENITGACVQVKQSASRGAAGYAFVSLESTDHARRAIRHIHTTEFNGRSLIGDFARGPPCNSLQFVERNKSVARMHDADAVKSIDFDSLDRSVWDDLRAELARFGSLESSAVGRVRFRDLEGAKSVIRHHRFHIQGHEILPVYDFDEQLQLDSSRRTRQPTGRDDNSGNRGGSINRYGTRSDSRDRRGNRASPENGDRKRRRSPSPVNRSDPARDKAPRLQSRYGPQSQTSASDRDGDRRRSRSPPPRDGQAPPGRRSRSVGRRDQANPPRQQQRRSASPPLKPLGSNDRATQQRPRSPSPVAPRQARGGRSRSPVRGPPQNQPAKRDQPMNRPRSPSPRRDTNTNTTRQRDTDRANGNDRARPDQSQRNRTEDAARDADRQRNRRPSPPRGQALDATARDGARRERSPLRGQAATQKNEDTRRRQENNARPAERNGNNSRRSPSPRGRRDTAVTSGRDQPRGNGTHKDDAGRASDRTKDKRSAVRGSPASPPPSRDENSDGNPRIKSPRRAFKSSTAASAFEVDELMVDYDEDDE